jgi:hypothetical protein
VLIIYRKSSVQFSKSVSDTVSSKIIIEYSVRNVWMTVRSLHFLSAGWSEKSNEIFGQLDNMSRTRSGQSPIQISGTEFDSVTFAPQSK